MKKSSLTNTDEKSQEIVVEPLQYNIKNMIYVVRNQQVMLDSDLAMLYQVVVN